MFKNTLYFLSIITCVALMTGCPKETVKSIASRTNESPEEIAKNVKKHIGEITYNATKLNDEIDESQHSNVFEDAFNKLQTFRQEIESANKLFESPSKITDADIEKSFLTLNRTFAFLIKSMKLGFQEAADHNIIGFWQRLYDNYDGLLKYFGQSIDKNVDNYDATISQGLEIKFDNLRWKLLEAMNYDSIDYHWGNELGLPGLEIVAANFSYLSDKRIVAGSFAERLSKVKSLWTYSGARNSSRSRAMVFYPGSEPKSEHWKAVHQSLERDEIE